MPQSATNQPQMSANDWTKVYEEVFKSPIEAAGYICRRSTRVRGSLVRDIAEHLKNADIVLADLSVARPNVFCELGARQVLRRGTIIVTQGNRLASDRGAYWHLTYSTNDEGKKKFADDITALIKDFQADPDHPDSPFAGFLDLPHLEYRDAIKIFPGRSSRFGGTQLDPPRRGAFAHVQAVNSMPFVRRVRCSFRFFRTNGPEVFGEPMPGRWSGPPETLTPVPVNRNGQLWLVMGPGLLTVIH